jgi:hypothetical protein
LLRSVILIHISLDLKIDIQQRPSPVDSPPQVTLRAVEIDEDFSCCRWFSSRLFMISQAAESLMAAPKPSIFW